MTGFLEFRQLVKGNIRRTNPSPAGIWYRYLDHDLPEAQQFVVSLCYGFLQSSTSLQEVASGILADDDLLWYIQEFILREASAIQTFHDNEPLVVGLTAVGIIAPRSDPRDVLGWIDTLFHAAQGAGVPDIPVYFERVASQLQTRCPLAAERMRSYPGVIRTLENQKSNQEKDDAQK